MGNGPEYTKIKLGMCKKTSLTSIYGLSWCLSYNLGAICVHLRLFVADKIL